MSMNLEILMKMFPGRLVIDGREALRLDNKGYSSFANAVCYNDDLSRFPPLYDANGGKKKKAKWEINLVEFAKYLDGKGGKDVNS
jgi:hypothetical protein